MTTIRLHKREGGFLVVSNETLDDERLSFRALGVLTVMLSKPQGWRFSADRLRRQEGRDAVRTAISELERAGYVRREKVQDDRTGRWATVLHVAERPDLLPPATDFQASGEPQGRSESVGSPTPGFPTPGEPTVGSPGVGSPGVGFPGVSVSTETQDGEQRTSSSSEEEDPRITQALELLVDRAQSRHLAGGGEIFVEERWRAAVFDQQRRQHVLAIADGCLDFPDWTAEQLADAVTNVQHRTPREFYVATGEGPAADAGDQIRAIRAGLG